MSESFRVVGGRGNVYYQGVAKPTRQVGTSRRHRILKWLRCVGHVGCVRLFSTPLLRQSALRVLYHPWPVYNESISQGMLEMVAW